MKDIQLKLTLEEVNMILNALGEQPFKQVFQLITKIQAEASQQLDGEGPIMPQSEQKAE